MTFLIVAMLISSASTPSINANEQSVILACTMKPLGAKKSDSIKRSLLAIKIPRQAQERDSFVLLQSHLLDPDKIFEFSGQSMLMRESFGWSISAKSTTDNFTFEYHLTGSMRNVGILGRGPSGGQSELLMGPCSVFETFDDFKKSVQ